MLKLIGYFPSHYNSPFNQLHLITSLIHTSTYSPQMLLDFVYASIISTHSKLMNHRVSIFMHKNKPALLKSLFVTLPQIQIDYIHTLETFILYSYILNSKSLYS